MALLFSTSLFAEPKMPIDKNIYMQLHSSKNDYAELSHTGIIFHYGKVTIDLDKLSPEEVEFLRDTISKGQFVIKDKIQNVRGVEWVFKHSFDYPRFFAPFQKEGFIAMLSTVPVKKGSTYFYEKHISLKRLSFDKIPEYHEKQKALSDIRVGLEIDRITHSKIGSTPGALPPRQLALPAPSCGNLF